MGAALPKQFMPLCGRPVLEWAVMAFHQSPLIDHIILVLPNDQPPPFCAQYPKILSHCVGGQTRQESVYLGLRHIEQYKPKNILIHDGARPFVSQQIIGQLINELAQCKAVAPVYAMNDATIPFMAGPVQRIQTPQAFDYQAILTAHIAQINGQFRDDTSLYTTHYGQAVHYIDGDYANIKLTTPPDIEFATQYLQNTAQTITANGFDVHPYQPANGKKFMLGGVELPANIAPVGHSDADCLLHALTDAILGLCGAGDIGVHFPPSNPQWRGADSALFLAEAIRILHVHGGQLVHVDTTIIAETPKINPHRTAIQQRVAQLCALPPQRVSIKATTTEKLGFLGRAEGIAVHATATGRVWGQAF